MQLIEDRYIGDGVYASSDGYYIILDLRSQDSTTRIALEPAVYDALVAFRDDLEHAGAKQRAKYAADALLAEKKDA